MSIPPIQNPNIGVNTNLLASKSDTTQESISADSFKIKEVGELFDDYRLRHRAVNRVESSDFENPDQTAWIERSDDFSLTPTVDYFVDLRHLKGNSYVDLTATFGFSNGSIDTGSDDDLVKTLRLTHTNVTAYLGPGNDAIWTGSGDDYLNLGEGKDIAITGPGVDEVEGSSGTKYINTGEDRDHVRLNQERAVFPQEASQISLGPDNDLAELGRGNYIVDGGTGRRDTIDIGYAAKFSVEEVPGGGLHVGRRGHNDENLGYVNVKPTVEFIGLRDPLGAIRLTYDELRKLQSPGKNE